MVEARIWWIYINYGRDAVKRYIIKQLKILASSKDYK